MRGKDRLRTIKRTTWYFFTKNLLQTYLNRYQIVLNNIEVSCEFILKLKANLEAEESNIFSDPVEKVQVERNYLPVSLRPMQEKIKSCIHDLYETSRNYKQLLQVDMICISLSL